MPAVKIKSRETQKPVKAPSAKYSEEERKQDEAVCLSRMKEKSISHSQFLKFCRDKLGLEV